MKRLVALLSLCACSSPHSMMMCDSDCTGDDDTPDGGTPPTMPASQFSATATEWSVPVRGSMYGFDAAALQVSPWAWSTFDLNGDRKPDLVQTMDPATTNVWGGDAAAYWKVF